MAFKTYFNYQKIKQTKIKGSYDFQRNEGFKNVRTI